MRAHWRFAALAAALLATGATVRAGQTPPAPARLPDIVEGSPDAPATIVEYGSTTCSHCAAFHATTWPKLKAKYVDTGKAKFILREFPLDPRAAVAFLLARCAGPDRRDALIDLLFDRQNDWAFVPQSAAALRKLWAEFGLGDGAFDACVHDEKLYFDIVESRDDAIKTLDIHKTPTFFVNGSRLVGEASLEDFDRLLKPDGE